MRTTALLLALPLSLLSAGEQLEYRAEVNTRVRVTFEQEAELALVDQEVTIMVNGEEHPTGEQPDVEVTLSMTETTIFVDTYQAVDGDSKPTAIERHFEQLSGGYAQEVVGLPEGVDAPEPIEVASELEEQKVLFKWDAEEEEWVAAAPEDSEYDSDLLEELEQNADLSYLLSGDELAVEDTWDLEGEALRQILNVSGDLSMKPIDEDEEDESDDDQDEEWTADLFRLTLTELTDDVATIKIEIDVTRNQEGEVEPPPMPEGMEGDPPTITESEELQWVAEGVLVWDRSANRASSFELSGAISRAFSSEQEMDGQMGNVSISQAQTFEGTFTISIAFEEAGKEE